MIAGAPRQCSLSPRTDLNSHPPSAASTLLGITAVLCRSQHAHMHSARVSTRLLSPGWTHAQLGVASCRAPCTDSSAVIAEPQGAICASARSYCTVITYVLRARNAGIYLPYTSLVYGPYCIYILYEPRLLPRAGPHPQVSGLRPALLASSAPASCSWRGSWAPPPVSHSGTDSTPLTSVTTVVTEHVTPL